MTHFLPGSRSVIFMAVLAAYICMIDRLAISIAIIPMANEFTWDARAQGSVMSAFFLGYVLLQVPAGWLADRWGGKWVLGVGVLFWSLFTALTPPAAALGLGLLLVCRFLMGVFESVTWPALYNLLVCWVPARSRGLALGLLNSAVAGGTVIALVATPLLITHWGWRGAFYAYGSLGFLWCIFWFAKVPNRRVTDGVVQSIEGDADSDTSDVDTSFPALSIKAAMRLPAIWAMVAAHFATNWVVYLSLAWFPSMLNRAYGVPLDKVGLYAVIPFLVSVAATPLAGRLGDMLIERGVLRLTVRKGMQLVSLFGVSACFLLVGLADRLEVALAIFCLGNLLAPASIAGFGANPLDLAPRQAGTLYGASNAVASLAAAAAVYVAGAVLEATDSWALVFQSAAIVSITGGLIYWRWAGADRVFR